MPFAGFAGQGSVLRQKQFQAYMNCRLYAHCGVKPRPIWVRLPPYGFGGWSFGATYYM